MRMRSSASNFGYSFGPGPLTPAIKAIVIANVAVFLVVSFVPEVGLWLGLVPRDVLTRGALWQPFTYMFVHAGVFHILFNMLSLWMFGTDLERMWGSRFFVRYYLVAGLGGALTQILLGFVPGTWGEVFYYTQTVGASGAIFGLLLAYAVFFGERTTLMYFVFPIQAKYMVMIIGAIALYSAATGTGSGVAHTAHLGGLAAGWLYLRGRRMRLAAEIQYRFSRWRINRARKRFDVHDGGRRDDRPKYH
jgi:membrane associated rhomboid family serine protease